MNRLIRTRYALVLTFAAIVVSMMGLGGEAAAHQPLVPSTTSSVDVDDPTISKAYYAELKGSPDTYHIVSEGSFPLYLNILVPDIQGVTEDYTLTITRDGQPWAVLAPGAEAWKLFSEPFGGDRYLMGPEYRQTVPAGDYDVIVSSPDNVGKYVLAIGEIESFSFGEVLRTLVNMVTVKHYFGKPAVAVLESPLVSIPLGLLFVALLVVTWGVLWRRQHRR